ncbi:Bcr/CflA family drug resistance efflux transporter [Glutamicibacter uratoxydans]|uniref:Bcr/CflA family drug resistance efflux transporter n=1 Tax=Glutamicibacter uratoxydans TaxID=43667 RepID=A0A4Y4DRG7_GLUUR|nr:multidrug effflux MFS transporter [Glutamicibacter uratoxydans]GED07929.1 Bcr/CflA family drug resistance efflux transporter [Glutamicibacter uratoxydans]
MNTSELPRKVGPLLATLLLLLTVFGPISMDLYLPVLPALTTDLGTVTSMAQLTLTSCLIGLAVGQIIAGPISDRYGRMRPLLVGLVAYIAASVLCALSPSVETLIFARLIQGLAGSVGIVIAQAAGRDVYEGGALIRFYGRVTVIGGLAAIVGPVIGGQLAQILDWRGIFLFLAGLGVLIMAATLLIYRETLPKKLRSTGGAKQSGNDFRKLFTDRVFIGAVLICGLTHAALFAYLAGATYILQDGYGLSPQGYALAFGANSAGYMIFGAIAGRTADRWSERGTLAVGVTMTGVGAVGLLATGLWSLPLPVILGSLFVMASGVAFAAPPSASLALAGYPELAGTASSVLGLSRFGLGAIAAPLVGIAGPSTVTPLGIITVLCVVLSALCLAMVRSQSSVLQRVNAH